MNKPGDIETGVFLPIGQIKTGEVEVLQAPPPPEVVQDLRTGQLPAGWHFADE